jgi:hypothetical protein
MIHTPVLRILAEPDRGLLLYYPEESRLPERLPQLEKLSETLLVFVNRYNQTADPFSWKYTAADQSGLTVAA